jgi:hypothetical protein
LALNFADYLSFENSVALKLADLTSNAQTFVGRVEKLGVPVCYIGTGPRLAQNIMPTSSPAQTGPVGLADVQQGHLPPQSRTLP